MGGLRRGKGGQGGTYIGCTRRRNIAFNSRSKGRRYVRLDATPRVPGDAVWSHLAVEVGRLGEGSHQSCRSSDEGNPVEPEAKALSKMKPNSDQLQGQATKMLTDVAKSWPVLLPRADVAHYSEGVVGRAMKACRRVRPNVVVRGRCPLSGLIGRGLDRIPRGNVHRRDRGRGRKRGGEAGERNRRIGRGSR